MRLRKTAIAGLLATCSLVGCSSEDGATPAASAPQTAAMQTFEWKLVTTWPKNLPALGTAPERLAENVEAMSAGRLKIDVYAAGELVPAFEVFDAVSQGTAQMGHGAAYYWRGKMPMAPVFATVPFGMNAQEDERLAASRRRLGTVARTLRAVRRGALRRRQHRHADGRLVQQGDRAPSPTSTG